MTQIPTQPPFVNLPLGRSSRAASIPAGARLLGALLFLLAVGGTPVTSQSRLTFGLKDSVIQVNKEDSQILEVTYITLTCPDQAFGGGSKLPPVWTERFIAV